MNGAQGWRMGDAPADYMAQMLENIVAFRITPQRVLAKSKLSQNRDERDRKGAVDGLRAAGQRAMAAIMAHDAPSKT